MNCNITKKSVRVINFRPRNLHTSPILKQNFIVKFQNKICLENILFVNYETSSSTQGNLIRINRYGKYSIAVHAVESWDRIQKQLKNMLLKIYPPVKLKQISLIFILNHINSSFDHAKIYMTLLKIWRFGEIISVINYTY